ncbi:MAG: hypothetical protein IKE55_03000 [Kiritimatiellae bacterium]|nr:hypothetical protein [Kiritimatiellia bacterium]
MKKMLTAKAKSAFTAILAVAATTVFAAPQVYYVNDVTSLTNVLANLPDVTDDTYNGSRIELAPGVYDLAGVYMNDYSHLYVKHARDLLIAGTGDGPGATVLLGGGAAGNHRVLELYGGGDSWWNTISNITICGGYSTARGGAGAYSRSVATMFVDCVISNNTSTFNDNSWAGGAVKNGCAVRTYFANNSSRMAGGAIECGAYKATMDLQPYTESCYFTNNVQTTGYSSYFGGGAVSGGFHTNDVFVGNSAVYGGAGGYSNTGGFPVFVGCTFTANKSSSYGGALCRPRAITNCVFTANTGNGGAIFAQYWSGDQFTLSHSYFTNNVSTTYGGAIRANSGVFDSTFFGNVSAYGGGAFGQLSAKSGDVVLSGCTFVSNTVNSTENHIQRYGGAVTISGGDVVDCTFIDNLQTNGAGAAICLNGAAGAFRLSGCTFIGNKGKFDGGVVYANNRQTISNCTFTGEMKGYHGVIANGQNLVDCTISNVSCSGWHFYNCNLARCSVISNSFVDLPLDDTNAALGTYTNVNCIFYGNEYNGGMTHFIKLKTLVNCTFAENRAKSAGNYGTFLYSCIGWNTLFFGNVKDASTPLDLRTKVLGSAVPFEMHNCIFTALDTEVTAEGFDNCSLVPMAKVHCEWKDGRLCLAPRSCAVDAATSPAWLLTAIGNSDVYGNPRVFNACLDVGAVECQERKPGFMLMLW